MMSLGVTGTDTGVGKTVVTAALTAWMRRRGIDVVAMKPIETGGSTSDAELLREACGRAAPMEEVCIIQLGDPLAPLVAARNAGVTIGANRLDRGFRSISRERDGVIVEGAGGLLVPIAAGESYATLFKRWDLDLVIVAANRLGVINHSLLTIGAASAAGIPILAVVLNEPAVVTPEDVSRTTNRKVIEELSDGVPVISFPFVDGARDISLLAAAAEESGLGELILQRCRQ